MSDLVIEIPLRITISAGSPAPAAAVATTTATQPTAGLERVDIDPNYANRKGYIPDFLGVHVPLPPLTDEQRRNAAKNSMARPTEDNAVLPYHHFSIVMNRRRQLAYYTAVNIHGARAAPPDVPVTAGTLILASPNPNRSAKTSTLGTPLTVAISSAAWIQLGAPTTKPYWPITIPSISPTARPSTLTLTRAMKRGRASKIISSTKPLPSAKS